MSARERYAKKKRSAFKRYYYKNVVSRVKLMLGRAPKWFPESEAFDRILKLFIKPLMFHESFHEDATLAERINEVLVVDGRTIETFVVTTPFTCPGVIWQPGSWRNPLTSESKMPKDAVLIIRRDASMPNRIDVERIDVAAKYRDCVFNIFHEEYVAIRKFLRPVNKKGEAWRYME
jgi:hypothetical protein